MAEDRDDLEREPEYSDAQDSDQGEADRGLPSINKRGKPTSGGVGQKLIITSIGLLVVLALVAVNGGFGFLFDDDPAEEAAASNEQIGNRLGPAPELPEPPKPPEENDAEEAAQPEVVRTGQIAPPSPQYPTAGGGTSQDAPPTPQERKRAGALLVGSASASSGTSGGGGSPQLSEAERARRVEEQARQKAMEQVGGSGSAPASASMMGGGSAERADGLDNQLQPTRVEGARASVIADRNMFITKGTFLDCALETAISSDVSGMTSCRLTRDVYSTSGKVLLLERGSRIVGEYQSGVQRGKARIFVLWTRIETPNGVVVNLDSPGTDALGRGGHSGYINTHFWERFGGAIMLSLIDDVGTYVAEEASGRGSNGNNQINFGGTAETARDAAGIALENSIDIPPTLEKNQGEHINIFVARDLDFRGVYELRATN